MGDAALTVIYLDPEPERPALDILNICKVVCMFTVKHRPLLGTKAEIIRSFGAVNWLHDESFIHPPFIIGYLSFNCDVLGRIDFGTVVPDEKLILNRLGVLGPECFDKS